MKYSVTRLTRLVPLAALGVFGSALFAVASCASVGQEGEGPTSPESTLPESDAGLDAEADAQTDAECDVSDPGCVAQAVGCEGAEWCPVPTGVNPVYALVSVWGAGKDDVWVGGSGGTLIHWDGASWTPTTTGVKNTFNVISGNGSRDVWAASSTEVLLHLDGTTWTRAPSNSSGRTKAPIFAGWSDGSGAVRFGTASYELPDDTRANQAIAKRASDGGIEWTSERGTATVHGIWGSSPDDLWLVGDNRGSANWQRPGWAVHGTRTQGGDFVWSEIESQSSAILESVWGSSADDVWAVGGAGTIRHINGAGSRWEIVPSPTAEALHAVWGSGPNDVWAVGEAGTILHWDGATWRPSIAAFADGKKRPHLYGIWGSGPNDVWIVGDSVALHYNGGVT